jgi:hypothetical protein
MHRALEASLRGKKIVLVPTGGANGFNLKTLNVNELLKQLGASQLT